MAQSAYKRRFGDRRDGRLIRSFPAYNKFMPFFMRQRNDAEIYFSDSVEITDIDRWLRQKRAEGYKGMGMLHLMVASYIRTVSCRPALNRFVSGQRVYAHSDISVIMTVKKAMSDDAEETSIKVHVSPSDTIYDVYRKINAQVDEVKANAEENGTDKFADFFSHFPRFLVNLAVDILKLFDYFGWLSSGLLEISPFHGSMIITDLGSIGIPPVSHHIYNFGNLPLFLSFGAKRHGVETDDTGRLMERKYVDFHATLDERICDGFYLAGCLKYLKYYLKNPQLLEAPPEQVVQDIY